MSYYESALQLHAVTGTLALLCFWTAAALRKGSSRHRLVGRLYLLAMLAVVLSSIPLVWRRWLDGQLVAAAFFAYLLVLVVTGVWTAWRAIRDKHDPHAYTGGVYHALAVACLLAGLGVLALGLRHGQPLLTGFSLVGLYVGVDMLLRVRRLRARPLWWREEHYTAMLGNGVATHIAFLAIGLPRLLPMLDGTVLHYAAWFGPLLVALAAKLWLDRRCHRAESRRQTSPSSNQPSPVPRWNTRSVSSTVPAGNEGSCASRA